MDEILPEPCSVEPGASVPIRTSAIATLQLQDHLSVLILIDYTLTDLVVSVENEQSLPLRYICFTNN
jgi:hypothetical protein